MDELIEQFAIEARELVELATKDLNVLETDPGSKSNLESLFRAIHTLKGSVGLFDLGPMQPVLHRAEDLLTEARAGRILVDRLLTDTLVAVVEWVDDSIDGIVETGRLAQAQDSQVPRLLDLLKGDMTSTDGADASVCPSVIPDWALWLQQQATIGDIDAALVAIRYEPHPECFFSGDDPLATIARLAPLRYLRFFLRETATGREQFDPFRCNLVIEALFEGSVADVEAVFRLIPDQIKLISLPKPDGSPSPLSPAASSTHGDDRQTSTIRVEAGRIDRLVAIAGELVTAKNGLVPLAETARGSGNQPLARQILSAHAEIERLVASLYGAVTQARMVPLETIFRRFPRLVRETASRLGKSIDLVIEGQNVEADREIVENLFEPLLHLVRNGLDHGIESKADRHLLSKPERGRLLLRARQRGDEVEIEVVDDGRGMDTARILSIATERGLVSQTRSSAPSAQEILQLVFAPGFSTATSVTDLSGRGVGLDVVQTSVQKLGGRVELHSVAGSGTSFILSLPVSLAMAQLIIVEVGGERYGIPLSDVIETHRLAFSDIQAVRSGRAFILRNRTIPLVYLAELLQMPYREPILHDLRVLIVRLGEGQVAVVVDAIWERSETLTRPLAGLLRGVTGIAGTTLLGDGKVLLVLDLEELLE